MYNSLYIYTHGDEKPSPPSIYSIYIPKYLLYIKYTYIYKSIKCSLNVNNKNKKK